VDAQQYIQVDSRGVKIGLKVPDVQPLGQPEISPGGAVIPDSQDIPGLITLPKKKKKKEEKKKIAGGQRLGWWFITVRH
jgi:hypothetical protein